MAGITIVGLIGLFEATIGLLLAQKFKANLDDLEEEVYGVLENEANPQIYLVLFIVLIYLFIGWIGTLFV